MLALRPAELAALPAAAAAAARLHGPVLTHTHIAKHASRGREH